MAEGRTKKYILSNIYLHTGVKKIRKRKSVCSGTTKYAFIISFQYSSRNNSRHNKIYITLSLSLLLSFSLFPDSTAKARHNKFPHIHYTDCCLHEKSTIANIVNAM